MIDLVGLMDLVGKVLLLGLVTRKIEIKGRSPEKSELPLVLRLE